MEDLKDAIQPVILAGGVGSRLWPLSRQLFPKQMFKLTGNDTLLQQTYKRLCDINASAPIIVAGQDHRFLIRDQLQDMAPDRTNLMVIEPIGRNTAPACIVAALIVAQEDPDKVLFICPADHMIPVDESFFDCLAPGVDMALSGSMVTFGIKPDRPETAYGYIESDDNGHVKRFVEKPDRPTAERYLASGNFYWNSGMFLMKASTLISEAERLVPDMLLWTKKALEHAETQIAEDQGGGWQEILLDENAYSACPADSIDYAILERASNLKMVPADFKWNDVGSWNALYDIADKDENDNAIHGDVVTVDTQRCLIRSSDRLVATVGLKDVAVVETSDAVLVVPLSNSQDVKKVVSYLKSHSREEHLVHKTAYRPWGSYTVLEESERFKIKRLTVNPGTSLSLQMHYHRSEHWIVVKGTAKVTRDDDVFLLRENESTFILPGQRHRLENPGKIALEIIEVQNGSYLGEDDIVRFDDVYGRTDS